MHGPYQKRVIIGHTNDSGTKQRPSFQVEGSTCFLDGQSLGLTPTISLGQVTQIVYRQLERTIGRGNELYGNTIPQDERGPQYFMTCDNRLQNLAHPVCRHVATNPGGIVHVVYRRSRHHLFQKPETLLRE